MEPWIVFICRLSNKPESCFEIQTSYFPKSLSQPAKFVSTATIRGEFSQIETQVIPSITKYAFILKDIFNRLRMMKPNISIMIIKVPLNELSPNDVVCQTYVGSNSQDMTLAKGEKEAIRKISTTD